MKRETFSELHRTARLGNLGTLACRAGELYDWFLTEVYDLRFPHVGDRRYLTVTTFDSLRVSTARRLAWRRQAEYAAHVKYCRSCLSVHHEHHDCNRY